MEVCYEGSPVPKSPFCVAVTEGCDPSRVRVHGPGLKGGTTNKPNKFTVETRQVTQNLYSKKKANAVAYPACVFNIHHFLCRGAGTGGLGLAMEGPSEAKMSCTDNKDGSCSVEYIPYEPGTYNLNVTYGGRPIKGAAANHFKLVLSFLTVWTRVTKLSKNFLPFLSVQAAHSQCQSVTWWTAPRWSARVQAWETMSGPTFHRHSQWTPLKLVWPHCRSVCKDPKASVSYSISNLSFLMIQSSIIRKSSPTVIYVFI